MKLITFPTKTIPSPLFLCWLAVFSSIDSPSLETSENSNIPLRSCPSSPAGHQTLLILMGGEVKWEIKGKIAQDQHGITSAI